MDTVLIGIVDDKEEEQRSLAHSVVNELSALA